MRQWVNTGPPGKITAPSIPPLSTAAQEKLEALQQMQIALDAERQAESEAFGIDRAIY